MSRIQWVLFLGGGLLVLALLAAIVLGDSSVDSDDETDGSDGSLLGSDAAENEGRPGLEGAGRGAQAAARTAPLPPPVDLDRVDRERDLHGLVVREDGSPVPGARLEVVYYPWRYGGLLTDGLHSEAIRGPACRSAADGTFSLRLRRGDHVHLRVAAAGLATTEYTRLQAGEYTRVVLQEPVRLVVKARTPTGVAAVNLALRIFRGGGARTKLERTGTTGPDGTYTFDDLPPGGSLYLDPRPQREGWGHPSWIWIDLPKSGDLTHELTLPTGRTLRGAVTDKTTGRPIPGARVGLGWVLTSEVKTDAEGRYALPGWSGKGVSEIHVLAPGYGRAQAFVGEKQELDFELLPGSSARGRVLTSGGAPAKDAQVLLVGSQRLDGQQNISMGHARTDADGRFRLTGLRRDMPHVLTIVARGYAQYLGDVAAPGADEIDLGQLTLGPARTLKGTLITAAGKPSPRVPIDLRLEEPRGTGYRYGREWERATDDQGRFRFEDLPPGTYRVTTRPSSGPSISKRVTLLDRDEATSVTLVAVETRAVRIRVTDEAGTPQHGIVIGAYGKGLKNIRGKTDEDGITTLQIPPVPARLSVTFYDDRGFAHPPPIQLAPDEVEAAFVLGPAAITTGTLLDPAGKPLPWARILVERNGQRMHRSMTATEADGRFRINTPVGWVISIVFPGQVAPSAKNRYAVKEVPMQGRLDGVRAGSQDVVVRATAIPTERSLTVRVVDPDGKPVEGASIALSPRPFHMKGTYARTDATGRVTIEKMTATKVRLRVVFTATEQRPWLRAGMRTVMPEGQEVTLFFRRGAVISGVLLRHDGKVVVKGGIVAFVEGFPRTQCGTDAEGKFILVLREDLEEPVTLRATAVSADGTRMVKELAGVRAGTRGLELRLDAPK